MNRNEQSHAGFEQDERDYWQMRDELVRQYRGRWVAVHKGRVTAVGDDFVQVAHEGSREDGYAFCNLVGLEDQVVVTQRREYSYQINYWPQPIPRVPVTVSNSSISISQSSDQAIPDTGADLSCLPIAICQSLDLFSSEVFRGAARSIGGATRTTVFVCALFTIAEREYRAVVEPVADNEWIIGRDVLNQMVITFDGPGRRVIIA